MITFMQVLCKHGSEKDNGIDVSANGQVLLPEVRLLRRRAPSERHHFDFCSSFAILVSAALT